MARPTKLSPEVSGRLVHAVSLGASYIVACEYAGISYQTLLNWRKRAQEGNDEQLLELFDRIKRAQGQAAVLMLAQIEKAANRDWRAAAWKLERLFPDSYGRRRFAGTRETPAYTPPQQYADEPEDTLAEITRVLTEIGFLLPQSGLEEGSVGKHAMFSGEDSGEGKTA